METDTGGKPGSPGMVPHSGRLSWKLVTKLPPEQGQQDEPQSWAP